MSAWNGMEFNMSQFDWLLLQFSRETLQKLLHKSVFRVSRSDEKLSFRCMELLQAARQFHEPNVAEIRKTFIKPPGWVAQNENSGKNVVETEISDRKATSALKSSIQYQQELDGSKKSSHSFLCYTKLLSCNRCSTKTFVYFFRWLGKKFIDTERRRNEYETRKMCFYFIFGSRKNCGTENRETKRTFRHFGCWLGHLPDKDQHILNILNGQSSQQTDKEMLNSELRKAEKGERR